MKLLLVAFLSLASFSALANDYLPGGIKLRGTDIELRAACAKEVEGKCELVHLFRINHSNNHVQQLTAYPVAFDSVDELKMQRGGFNVMTMDQSCHSGELEGINQVFLPLLAPVDAVGYAIGTPFYLAFKSIDDAKYNKFKRAFRKGELLNMGGQPFDFLTEDICKASRSAREAEVMQRLNISHPMLSSELVQFRQAMGEYGACGVEKK